MSDHTQFTRGQAKNAVCERLNLPSEEQNQRTGSSIPIYESRTGWAISRLAAAGYVERISQGTYRITEAGKRILGENLTSTEFVRRLRTVINSQDQNDGEQIAEQEDPINNISLMEQLDMIVREMHNQLSREIMAAIMSVEGSAGDTFLKKS